MAYPTKSLRYEVNGMSDNKQNICTNLIGCEFKTCPHRTKHPTSYYFDGKKWLTCRELPCKERYYGKSGKVANFPSNHICIEVKGE